MCRCIYGVLTYMVRHRTNLKVGYDKHRMFDIKSRAELDKL